MSLTRTIERLILDCLPVRYRTRLKQASVHDRAIVRGVFWVATFVLAAKLIAAGKDIAVAWRYGTSAVLDGYLLVFNLASWPISLIFSVMHMVLVPWLVRLQQAQAAECALHQRQITAWVWILALALTAVFAMVLPPLVSSGALGLSAHSRQAALGMLPWMAAMVGLGIVASWHACQTMSVQRHMNTFMEAMPALGILLAVMLWPADDASPLLWGTVAGFAVQAALMIWAVRAAGMPAGVAWSCSLPLAGVELGGAAWLLAGQALMGIAGVVDQLVLAHLPEGSVATYAYANRIMALVLTLSATVLGRALLPIMSGIDEIRQRHALIRRWAWRAFWMGVAVAVVLVFGSQPLVELLFERGAFTARDSKETAQLLLILGLQLPAYLYGIVWLQFALSQQGAGRPLWWVAVTATAVKMGTMAALVWGAQWGALAVASSQVSLIVAWCLATRGIIAGSGRSASRDPV